MPMKPIELDKAINFRLPDKQFSAVQEYAKSIEAPLSYALRRLISAGLARLEKQEQTAA
jgi:hypothetical protein